MSEPPVLAPSSAPFAPALRFQFTQRAHLLVGEVVRAGSSVLDATAGRGRDTLFLARCVGAAGRVLAVDVQAEAIHSTDALLRAAGVRERVELVESDHAELAALLVGRVLDGALFNLGFLPGGSREVVTRSDSTLRAIDAALAVLRPGGRIVVTSYVGHPGGRREATALLRAWRRANGVTVVRELPPPWARRRDAPRLFVLERRSTHPG
ncbi:MAG: class I SAM-dependent methyltransferase [Planctomycetota bacterium]